IILNRLTLILLFNFNLSVRIYRSIVIDGDLKNFSYSSLRKKIKGLSASDWDTFKPKKSNLTGDEWRRIVEILMK
ncbi:hypothetical protein, partial [Bacteroides caccae]